MRRHLASIGAAGLAFGLFGACAGVKPQGATGAAGGAGSGAAGNPFLTGAGGSTTPIVTPPACDPCTDFPAAPVVDGTAPPDAAQTFGGATSGSAGGGPCLIEPELGALYPNNWLRPRFRVKAPAGQDVFELRLHAKSQANDLVVYTGSPSWTMPKDLWAALSAHSHDEPITVTVRGASKAGGAATVAKGTSGDIAIAPVSASGTMVYWSTSGMTYGQPKNGDTVLSGFAVGDESVATVLKPNQAQQLIKDQGGNVLKADSNPARCIGCHTSTPDGAFISYNDFYPWNAVLASGKAGSVGASPPFLRAGGWNAITQPWIGMTTYSRAHWRVGDHVMVASFGTSNSDSDPSAQLAWFDLESTASGTSPADLKGKAFDVIARTGDARGAAAPSWSHDGTFIVYTSTDSEKSGRLGSGVADLYRVEYGGRAGGAARPITGAAEPDTAEYYPALSSNDRLIAYNAIPQTVAAASHPAIGNVGSQSWDGMYAQPATEVFVIPAAGGVPVRLAANDPPACAGAPSPGINNSWPKWAPEARTTGGKTYYWLIFSSWRDGATAPNQSPIAQLYITGVVEDEAGHLETHGAIYLWNQPPTTSNHTPAWDVFQIPIVQ
jgi:hypothetical protein